jgi:hypothetical protein
MSVRRSTAIVAGVLAALALVQAPTAQAAVRRPMQCPPDIYYGNIVDHGDVMSPVGAAQANYNGTNSTQINRFSSQVSGTITFTATASVSVSGGVVDAAIQGTFGITTSLSLTATIGNEVTFNSAPRTTAHAEFGVWRLKTTGTYSKVQPTCTTLNYATTAYSPHYVGWYTWIS